MSNSKNKFETLVWRLMKGGPSPKLALSEGRRRGNTEIKLDMIKMWDTFWLNCGHWYKVLNFYQLLCQFIISVKIIFFDVFKNDNSLTL